MTSGGGTNHLGSIFRIFGDGSGYETIFSFDSLSGYGPEGSLCLANDGLLYGMTRFGGLSDSGAVFRIDPTTGVYDKLLDLHDTIGAHPYGDLMQASDGLLYGMTYEGGNWHQGTFFSYEIATGMHTRLIDFTGYLGAYPFQSVVQSPGNGKLYGITRSGGYFNKGCVFSYDLATGHAEHEFYGFDDLVGKYPTGNLCMAPNGYYYGTTSQGGPWLQGNVFRFDSTANECVNTYTFHGVYGSDPEGSLVVGADGKLYGTTGGGGDHGYGTLFRFATSSNVFEILHDFGDGGTDGLGPKGSLLLASDGNMYGTTSTGYVGVSGSVFKYDPGANAYSVIHLFDEPETARPEGSLIEVNAPNSMDEAGREQAGLEVYPDPTSGPVVVRSSNDAGRIRNVRLFDLLGIELIVPGTRVVIARASLELDLTGLASGQYVVKAIVDDGIRRCKVMKE